MTIVAHSYRQWGLNENQTCCDPFRAREGLVQGHRGYVVKQHHQSGLQQASNRPNSHIQAERGETLSQIHAFYWLGLWTPSGPLLMEPDDLLDTPAYSAHHWEPGPCVVLVPIPTSLSPNPLASPLGGVGIGGRPPGPTLWSFMHHAILLSSCCCFLSMLLGGVGMF